MTDQSGVTSIRADRSAVLVAAMGSAFVGTVPTFAVGLYREGFDVVSVLFWRYAVALTLLWPLAIWTSNNIREVWSRDARNLFLNALLIGVAQTFTYFRAVETIPSSIVVTIFFTYPLLTLAIDRFAFGLKLGPGPILSAGLVFCGALLVGWPTLSLGEADPIGLACAVATPMLFSVYVGIAYRFARQVSPFAGASVIYTGLLIGYVVAASFVGLKFPTSGMGWLSVLAIGTIGGAIQIASFVYALPRLSTSGYSIIVSLELVTVVVLGVLVLGEILTVVQAMGVLLVIVGVVTDRLPRRSQ